MNTATDHYGQNRLLKPISPGSKVLVVGLLADQLPDRFRDDDRVIVWPSNHMNNTIRGEVPVDVEQIVVCRFISHASFEQLRKVAMQRHIWLHSKPYNTGQIKRALDALLGNAPEVRESDLEKIPAEATPNQRLTAPLASHLPRPVTPPKESSVPTATAETNKTPRSGRHPVIQNWVQTHIDMKPGETYGDVARRLYKEFHQEFPSTSEKYLHQVVGKVARQLGLKSAKKYTPPGQTKHRGRAATPVVRSTQTVSKNSEPVGAKANILALLDDAIAGMQLIRDEVSRLQVDSTALDKIRRLLGPS